MTTKDNKQTISGTISAIKYRNSDGWSVFSLQDEPLGFTGTLAEIIAEGTEVTCTGTIANSKYGEQMKCESIVPEMPDTSTDAGVTKLLQRLPGIGPKKAMEAVMTHGAKQAWEHALNDPAKLGVHPRKVDAAKRIASMLIETHKVLVYLLGIGLTDHQAGLIYDHFKGDSIKVVSQNPYKLIEIDGFGFLTVDKIALKAGMQVGNPSRVSACVLFVLEDSSSNEGHIWHIGWNLADIVLEKLKETAVKAEVSLVGEPDVDAVRSVIHNLQAEKKVVIQKGKVFPVSLMQAEDKILGFIGV